MASSADAGTASAPGRGRWRLRAVLESWNRRLHYYLGLYFLLFIWLFSLTGLLLNHPGWARHAADRRAESREERAVDIDERADLREQTRGVMQQLGLEGEPDWPASMPPGRLHFSVSRPGDAASVRVDLATRAASIQRFENTAYAAFRILHTFNGSRYNASEMHREWVWTTVWTVLMDAFAAGLLIMVFGSYYMWYRLKRTHGLGLAFLTTGILACGLFVFALR